MFLLCFCYELLKRTWQVLDKLLDKSAMDLCRKEFRPVLSCIDCVSWWPGSADSIEIRQRFDRYAKVRWCQNWRNLGRPWHWQWVRLLHSRIQKSLNALVSGMLVRSILGPYSMRVPTTLANFLNTLQHFLILFVHCDLRGQKAIQCERAKSWPVMWKLSRSVQSVQMHYRLM